MYSLVHTTHIFIQLLCSKIEKKNKQKKHTHTHKKKKKKTKKQQLIYRYLLPDLAPCLTLSGSNYPYLEKKKKIHSPKDVRAIEVRLFFFFCCFFLFVCCFVFFCCCCCCFFVVFYFFIYLFIFFLWLLSNIVVTLLGKRELFVLLFFGL